MTGNFQQIRRSIVVKQMDMESNVNWKASIQAGRFKKKEKVRGLRINYNASMQNTWEQDIVLKDNGAHA